MNIHEYQAKDLLAKFGVPLLKGGVAYTEDEAMDVARKLGGPVSVVKSQIHAGGRGKGRFKNDPGGKGGVRVVKSVDEVGAQRRRDARPGAGHQADRPGRARTVKRALYRGRLRHQARALPLACWSTAPSAASPSSPRPRAAWTSRRWRTSTPEKIVKQAIDPAAGFQAFQGRKIAFALGLEGKQVGAFATLLGSLYKAFIELDCLADRDQPAGRHRRGRRRWRSMPR